jgi:predicted DNA-binding transcriptional regulator YafY
MDLGNMPSSVTFGYSVRASRLLRILLILQNRGRMTTLQLASELEVARRTVLRDLEALEQAGLPIVTSRGNAGGVELAFNYRSRFVGLDAQEAEALGVILGMPKTALAQLGIQPAAHRACEKLLGSLPDAVRQRVLEAQQRFRFSSPSVTSPDPRVAALAEATRGSFIVRLNAHSSSPRTIHPIALQCGAGGWAVVDEHNSARPIPQRLWGDIKISARRFAMT